MRKLLPLIGLTMVFLAASAQEPKRFDLNLADADLAAATQMLASRSGQALQFVFKPAAEPYGRITLNLHGVTVEEAIKFICEAAGAVVKKDPSGVFVIGHASDFPTPTEPVDPPVKPVKAPSVVSKIFLKNYHPKDMLELLYAQEVDSQGEWKALLRFQKLNTPIPEIAQSAPMILNTPITQSPQPQDLTQGGDNGIIVPGGANQIGGRGGQGGRLGQGGVQGGNIGGQGNQGGNINLQGGQGFVPEGIDQITYDPTDNSLIVKGTDSAIQELERLISRFDVKPKQVTIKVEFITTTNNVDKSFGIDWLFQRGNVFLGNTPGTQARTGDPFFVNWATGNLTTRLRTLLLEGNGTVVNAPFIRTLNNQPAFIQQTLVTWIITTQTIATNTGIIQTPVLTPVPVNSGLSVQPRINNDDTVTMTIAPTVSELGKLNRNPLGTDVPDISTQQIFVTARVKSGETIVLGGLTRKQESNSYQRYPILSDLPIIGNLFKSSRRTVNNQELLVFITPTIIPDEDGGGQ